MEYKLEIRKLEEIKRKKLEDIKILRDEISSIENSITTLTKKDKELNYNADLRKKILGNFSKDKVRKIIAFIVDSCKDKDIFRKYYKDIDVEDMFKDDQFLDLVIVNIGENVMKQLTERFEDVVEENGESLIVGNDVYMKKGKDPLTGYNNFAQILLKKMTKPDIITAVNNYKNKPL